MNCITVSSEIGDRKMVFWSALILIGLFVFFSEHLGSEKMTQKSVHYRLHTLLLYLCYQIRYFYVYGRAELDFIEVAH